MGENLIVMEFLPFFFGFLILLLQMLVFHLLASVAALTLFGRTSVPRLHPLDVSYPSAASLTDRH